MGEGRIPGVRLARTGKMPTLGPTKPARPASAGRRTLWGSRSPPSSHDFTEPASSCARSWRTCSRLRGDRRSEEATDRRPGGGVRDYGASSRAAWRKSNVNTRTWPKGHEGKRFQGFLGLIRER